MASGDDRIDVMESTSSSGDGLKRFQARDSEDDDDDRDKSSNADKNASYDLTGAGMAGKVAKSDRKIGHRRVGEGGEITYKKIQSTQIMNSIQLGIQHAIGGLASKPERDLLMQDFMTVETTNFPHEGSNHTPAHHYSEFRFRTYAPIAFRYFRDLFGIQPDDFLMSMCSSPLRELSNPGASGSIFYLTQDDEFIIKTVQHKEGEFLQKLLPGYYMNLNQNPRTLLPKFFGLYCYQCNSKNVRLVAMNNLLPSVVTLHQKYDLKGSTYKRKANKSERQKKSPTYKDLDFMEHHPEGIFLEADTYAALIKTIQRDCRVLESFKIMDYSLLVGIHNLDEAQREKVEERKRESDDSDAEHKHSQLTRARSINRQRLVAHSTAMESIQAESEPIDEEEDVPPGGIPARNARGERLLLFVGVIDILQSYRLRKKLEHTWKSMIHDGDTVSVHRPGFYAQRFLDFMAKTVFKKIPSPLKHSPSKRKSITRPLRPPEEVETPGKIVSTIGKPIADYTPGNLHSRDFTKLSPRSSLRSSLTDFTETTESTWHQPPPVANDYPSVLSDRLKNVDFRGPVIRSQESGDRLFQKRVEDGKKRTAEQMGSLSRELLGKLYPVRSAGNEGSLADSGIHTDIASLGVQHVNISIVDQAGPSVSSAPIRILRDIGVDTRNENSLQDIPFIDEDEINEVELGSVINPSITKYKSLSNINERIDKSSNTYRSRENLSSSLNRARSPTFIDRCKKFFADLGLVKVEDGEDSHDPTTIPLRSPTPDTRESSTLPKNMRIMSENRSMSIPLPQNSPSERPAKSHSVLIYAPSYNSGKSERFTTKEVSTLDSTHNDESSPRFIVPKPVKSANSKSGSPSSLHRVKIKSSDDNEQSPSVMVTKSAGANTHDKASITSSILVKPGSRTGTVHDKRVAIEEKPHISVIQVNTPQITPGQSSSELIMGEVVYVGSNDVVSKNPSGSTIVILQPPD